MSEISEDTGVIVALMERFNEQRLPKALALKARVEQGECLSEHDIAFLDEVFRDANHRHATGRQTSGIAANSHTRNKPVQRNYR